jgi:oxygen-independent coproporphyrinogen-3 oxidase
VEVARLARDAGFEHVSLDLIYGTPGERDEDWAGSLDAVAAAGVDHVSAYALTVEPGTRLNAQVRRGQLAAPDEDDQARRYRQADAALAAVGLEWYEVCSWAASPAARCRHNLGYWRSHDWWGLGPGAHSHVGGVRWWNVLHPSRYARTTLAGRSPAARARAPHARAAARGADAARAPPRRGLALADAAPAARELAASGLIDGPALRRGVARLTLDGRLLADLVARKLLDG